MEGRQAVRELLAARRRRVREIWMTEGNDPSPILGEIDSLARAQHVPVRLVSHRRLESVQGTESPQGVVAFADALEPVSLEDLVLGKGGDPSPEEVAKSSAAAGEVGLGTGVNLDEDDDRDDLGVEDEDEEDALIYVELHDEFDEAGVAGLGAQADEADAVVNSDEPGDNGDPDSIAGVDGPGSNEVVGAEERGESDGAAQRDELAHPDGAAAPDEPAQSDERGQSGTPGESDEAVQSEEADSSDEPGESDDDVRADEVLESAEGDALDKEAPAGAAAQAGKDRSGEAGTGRTKGCFLVLVDGVTDPHNLGAILRSAECAGATGVVIPRHRAAHVTPAVTKAAAGAIEHLSMALVAGIPSALQDLARLGVTTVGLDERGDADFFGVELGDRPIALVLGAEGEGLGPLARRRCDVLAKIPLAGAIPSLNVSAAAAVACFEVARQRSH